MNERKQGIRGRIQEFRHTREVKQELLQSFGSDVAWQHAWTLSTFHHIYTTNFYYDWSQLKTVSNPQIAMHNDYGASAVALKETMLPFGKMVRLANKMRDGESVDIKFVASNPLFDSHTSASKNGPIVSVVMEVTPPQGKRRSVQPTDSPLRIAYAYNEETGILTVEPADAGDYDYPVKKRKIEARLADDNPFPDAGQRVDHRSIALSRLYISYEDRKKEQHAKEWTPQPDGLPVATITFYDGRNRFIGLPKSR
jgi:hypothetical protein